MRVRGPNGRGSRWPAADSGAARRGAVTLWIILALTSVLALFCLVLEVANLFLARIELENALEAAALAAVKQWGDSGGGDTQVPREVGQDFAAANTINGVPVAIGLNYNAAELPNQNADCSGNLIFGAIIDDDPEFVFSTCVAPSCGCGGIRVNALKADSGTSTEPRQIGIFYEDGAPGVTICSASFRLPQNPAVSANQQPYWDRNVGNVPGRSPVVSDHDAADAFNLLNPAPTAYGLFPGNTTHDVRGLDPDPVVAGATPEGSDYRDPTNTPPPPFDNPNGDVIFTFEDPVPTFTDRFQVLTIHFRPGSFQPPSDPSDPNTFEFLRFGASMNNLNPPAFPPGGNNNDADKMGIEGVQITIVTCNGETCTGQFVDDGINNGFSPSTFGGGSSGGSGQAFAVRAQATVEVQSLCCQICGVPIGPFSVRGRADALYDCLLRVPRLYHIEDDNFFCQVPCP